ncbi:MAG: site-specific DNA-methyltransferase [Terricaulis sp.]
MLKQLQEEFKEVLGCDPPVQGLAVRRAERFLISLAGLQPVSKREREVRLLALVNRKFEFNKPALGALFKAAAAAGISFNYHAKERLRVSFDRNDRTALKAALAEYASTIDLERFVDPVQPHETMARLRRELSSPTLVRKDSKPRDRSGEIVDALFGGFVFASFPTQCAHGVFSETGIEEYEPDFWRYLHGKGQAHLFSRERTLTYLCVPPGTASERVATAVSNEFAKLANHGHLALHFSGADGELWRAAALVTLFAEKFDTTHLAGNYFRPADIEAATRRHVPLADGEDYEFSVVNRGFDYRDTFVLTDERDVELLLLFQKNVADETPIPCPACRSNEVQGNSYPSLGVRSWECNNPLCPDRSKFNRGKRYSFLQLLKQQAIEQDANAIPRESIRRWSRDVVHLGLRDDVLPMLLRHYSLAGDGVHVVGGERAQRDFDRRITYAAAPQYFDSLADEGRLGKLLSSAYFSRFTIDYHPKIPETVLDSFNISGITGVLGDSTKLLRQQLAAFDGAVASPPYYNARDYAQWENIYGYLFDMYQNAQSVFGALKPGATYLFNIFDYFDNERNVVLSAMGDKRMILSAYSVYLFERAGFRCIGNVVWDKGAIEGKRAFNGGNFSPYYQAPFNCWEHILVFQKPGETGPVVHDLPAVLRAKPVYKMVRGENRHGHSAPFPEAIPDLLVQRLAPGAIVLDPFAGSMTTGRAALKAGCRAVCFDVNPDYFALAKRLLESEVRQLNLL